jgi:hypothetical protein
VNSTSAISVISIACIDTICRGAARLCEMTRVGGLNDLAASLNKAARIRQATSLDLIGHSSRSSKLLVIGRDTIDLLDRRIEKFFVDLSKTDVLRRLGVQQIRLLGCQTGLTRSGQYAMRRLAAIFDMSVYGTLVPLRSEHYDASGLRLDCRHILLDHRAAPRFVITTPHARSSGCATFRDHDTACAG